MMQPIKQSYTVKTFDVGPMQNLIYLITDLETRQTAIIDPAWDISIVKDYIKNNELILKKILLTHSHHDHINSVDEILKIYDIEIFLNNKEKDFWGKKYDNFVINHGGDIIRLGSTNIKSIHTPGHTPGSTCYLHGGNPEEMFNSLKNLKETLDKDTIILPGHDYSVKRESTIKEQITGNPFMHFEDLSKFVEYRMSIHDKTRPSPYDMVYKT